MLSRSEVRAWRGWAVQEDCPRRKKELWEKWKAGDSIRDIARALQKHHANGQKYEDWLKSRGEENSGS